MDRDGLGSMWLRWYVHRSDPRQPGGIVATGPHDSRQLRVRDLDDPDVWAAMSEPDMAQPQWSHTGRIADYEARDSGVEAAVFVVPVWPSPEGPVIIDGNHRARALYQVGPPRLDVDTIAFEPPPGWPDVLQGPRT